MLELTHLHLTVWQIDSVAKEMLDANKKQL
jgi:hypothetical protein